MANHSRTAYTSASVRTKCVSASRYKAMRAPTCGCSTCEDKWRDAQAARGIVVNK